MSNGMDTKAQRCSGLGKTGVVPGTTETQQCSVRNGCQQMTAWDACATGVNAALHKTLHSLETLWMLSFLKNTQGFHLKNREITEYLTMLL